MNKEGGLKVGVVGVPICAYIMLVHLPLSLIHISEPTRP